MKQINVSVQDETYRAAKGAAGHEGLGFARWIEKTIQTVCGLVQRVPENQTSTPATPLADVEVSEVKSGGAGSGVSEMNLETRLAASIKQADARKGKP